MANSFVMYRSFVDAISLLPEKGQRADLYDAIAKYALDGVTPHLEGVLFALFTLVKPQLDANAVRRENGAMGGRPKTKAKPENNQTITETKPNHNQRITEVKPNDNQKKPNHNQTITKPEPNVNVNANANVNVNERDISRAIIAVPHFPTTPEEVQSIATNACQRMDRLDAEKYLACRQSLNWHNANGQPISNIAAAVRGRKNDGQGKIRKIHREPDDIVNRRLDTGRGGAFPTSR